MIWVAVWVVLVLGAGVVLGVLGRDVYRKGKVFAAEMSEISARLDEVMTPLQAAAERLQEREESAVFADPVQVRLERMKAAKQARRAKEKARAARAADEPRFGATSQGATRPSRERTT